MDFLKIVEIVELNYSHIVLKIENKVRQGLRYTIPLIVPMIPDDPFELEVSGVVHDIICNEEENFCTVKIVNLEIENLIKVDSKDVYDEIVDWWQEKREEGTGEVLNVFNVPEKYFRYRELKRKMELLKLFRLKNR